MVTVFKTLLFVAAWGAFLGLLIWAFRRVWRRSEDRPALVVRLLATAADLAFLGWVVGPLFVRWDEVTAFVGVPMAAVGGLILALIWVPSLAESLGRWAGSLFDGGGRAPDPEPFFSVAEARRKQGRYLEAAAEVRAQLERFPGHFRGLMLLAEIQAEDLRDLPAATATIGSCLAQPGLAPRNVAFALLRLAEWHLRLAGDRAAARAALERIEHLLPGTPEAHLARQRLAHLTPQAMLEDQRQRRRPEVPRAPDRLGLRGEPPQITPRDSDPHARAEQLVAQLERFPEDNRTREELALLYRQEFHRPDLAAEQLEQLIAQPHAPAQQVVHWLNLLADVHLDDPPDPAAAQRALERIIERDPAAPAAEQARRRLALLPRQLAAKRTSPALKPGSADPRMGLKSGPPQRA